MLRMAASTRRVHPGPTQTAVMQVLLNKGVREDKILFLSLITAPEGIRAVCGRFPQVKIITSEINDYVDEQYQVVPAIGEFGDRYFCD